MSLRNLKPGDKVTCIDSEDATNFLTNGDTYIVDFIHIYKDTNDFRVVLKGSTIRWLPTRFKKYNPKLVKRVTNVKTR